MWNKYPYPASHPWRWACLVLWIVASLFASGCLSNPTPHPAVDSGMTYPPGVADTSLGAGPQSENGTGSDLSGGRAGQDAYGGPMDGEDSGDSSDDVGPDDGGGITEPLG